jgi:hypothetical protein
MNNHPYSRKKKPRKQQNKHSPKKHSTQNGERRIKVDPPACSKQHGDWRALEEIKRQLTQQLKGNENKP